MDSCEPLAMDGIRDRPPTDDPETDESRRGPISPFCWTLKSRHKKLQILGDVTFYTKVGDPCFLQQVNIRYITREETIMDFSSTKMDEIYRQYIYHFRLLHSKNISIPTFGIKVQSTKVPLVLNMLNNRILFEFGSQYSSLESVCEREGSSNNDQIEKSFVSLSIWLHNMQYMFCQSMVLFHGCLNIVDIMKGFISKEKVVKVKHQVPCKHSELIVYHLQLLLGQNNEVVHFL